MGDLKISMAVLGAGGVGKSCLTLRLATGGFENDYDPTIADLYETNIKVDEKTCALDIMDTAGQKQYNSLVDEWIEKGQAFLLVCSVDNQESVEQLPDLRDNIIRIHNDAKLPIVIAVNKCDLDKKVVKEEDIKELSEEWGGAPYFFTSAKTGENVTEAFSSLVKETWKYKASKKKAAPVKKKKPMCALI
mmetsp:Transcript_4354/g.5780  ORF Transcript_4354/g.5780 Transcript_4354/m.5780 type:complete len:190 (-) Transcript_4354:704-1273(-)